jgi:putative oxidoreductase
MVNNLFVDFGTANLNLIGLDIASLLLRITVGGILILHGVRKTQNKLQGTIKWFNSLGFPFNLTEGRIPAYLAAVNEILFGFLLLFGIFTQAVAVVVVSQMLVALFVAAVKEKSAFISMAGSPGVYGYELDLHYIFGAIALVLLGGGGLSFDALVPLIDPFFTI